MWSRLWSISPRLLALVASLVLASPLARADDGIDPPGRVARVSAALGTVSLQPAGSDGWVSDVLNRPLTNDDRLWSDRESRAELHIGSTAVRLGAETAVGILNIDDRSVQLRLSAGALQLRVRALEPDETMEVATPSASVAVLSAGSYRIDVNERGDELRVAVRQGQLAVTDASGATTVNAGELAIFHGSVNGAQTRALPAGDGFDQWATERDRREDRAVSTRYVSRDTIGYEDLDDYGTWRTVDEYGPVWVPQVAVGWSPYRDGHWAWIAPWGWTWIDDAPWGFAPFHYGRWVRHHDQWCWSPGPRLGPPVYAPALVGWVGGNGWSVGIGGTPVGWFPLGWNEVFVPSYRHSRTYVTNVNVTNIHVNNVYVTNYVDHDRGRPPDHGNDGHDRHERPPFANMAVTGAVIVTTRDAFQGSQRVGDHLAHLPAGALEHARPELAAPTITPSRESIGRPSRFEPPRREMWTRPVVSSTPPPAPALSFEAQRKGVAANGGRPLPIDRGPPAREPATAARPEPAHAARDAYPPGAPAPGTPSGATQSRPLPTPRPGGETPRSVAPVPASPADRPPPGYRPPPPSEWHRDAPPPADHRGPPDARPAPATDSAPRPATVPDRPAEMRPGPRPQYEPRSAPSPAADAAPRASYESRPAPQSSPPPPAPVREPPPAREYRAPAPPPAAEPPRATYEPRPAPQYSPPPTPVREPPPMREYRAPAPPPAPAPVARPAPPPPSAPPADKPHADKPHPDKPQHDH